MFRINYHVLVLGQYALKDDIFLKLRFYFFFLSASKKWKTSWRKMKLASHVKVH